MIKAEVVKAEIIAHGGYEVPNWVAKCRDMLIEGPAIAVLTLAVVAGFGILVWRDHQPAFTDQATVQSQPSSAYSLQVINANNSVGQTNTGATDSTTSVGPAPATSLNRLQSTGLTQNNVGGLNQGVTGNVQAAGKAMNSQLQNLGL